MEETDGKRLGIVIPVFNEAENIGATLDAIHDLVATPHLIHIVFDFDEDNTLPVVRGYIEQGRDISLVKNRRRGVVSALKTGLKEAREPYLLVTMADLSDDYAVVDRMCRVMDEGADLVCGSRYMKGGRQVGGPLIKKTISRIADVSLRYLAGLPTHDATNSFKLYRKSMVDAMEIESDGGFEVGMELVVKAHFGGYRVAEVPCTWQDRTAGESRFKIIRWAPKYLRWYFLALRKGLLRI
jgi:glycosyltransferase involved in cell wall biosynthesis